VCNIVQRGQIRPSHARDVDRYLQNLRAVAPTKGCKERGMGQAPLMEQQNEVLKRTAVFERSISISESSFFSAKELAAHSRGILNPES